MAAATPENSSRFSVRNAVVKSRARLDAALFICIFSIRFFIDQTAYVEEYLSWYYAE